MDEFSSLLESDDLEFVNALLEGEIEDPLSRPPPIAVPISPVQEAAERHLPLPASPRSPVSSRAPAQRCVAIYLGGTALQPGMTAAPTEPRFCTNLSCVGCDHIVLRFPNARWRRSVDCLFLRLNYPNRVDGGLCPAPGFCAFCCQCTFREEEATQRLSPFASNWVCRGHL
jgi:hypothetical protein